MSNEYYYKKYLKYKKKYFKLNQKGGFFNFNNSYLLLGEHSTLKIFLEKCTLQELLSLKPISDLEYPLRIPIIIVELNTIFVRNPYKWLFKKEFKSGTFEDFVTDLFNSRYHDAKPSEIKYVISIALRQHKKPLERPKGKVENIIDDFRTFFAASYNPYNTSDKETMQLIKYNENPIILGYCTLDLTNTNKPDLKQATEFPLKKSKPFKKISQNPGTSF